MFEIATITNGDTKINLGVRSYAIYEGICFVLFIFVEVVFRTFTFDVFCPKQFSLMLQILTTVLVSRVNITVPVKMASISIHVYA